MNDNTKFILWMVFTVTCLTLGTVLFIAAILTRNPFNP